MFIAQILANLWKLYAECTLMFAAIVVVPVGVIIAVDAAAAKKTSAGAKGINKLKMNQRSHVPQVVESSSGRASERASERAIVAGLAS